MKTKTAPTSDRLTAVSEVPRGIRRRAINLLRTEISFVPNSEFRSHDMCDPDSVDNIIERLSDSTCVPADLPAHLRRICSAELLTREQEVALFREMNFLKYRANSIRCRLDPENIDAESVERVEEMLDRAQQLRDHLIQANTRLVISIVKKFVTPRQSFDEMLSDGILTLMRAVEKFDYDRGFRFSTYAYRSIARNAYRTVATARQEQARFVSEAEGWAIEPEQVGSSSAMNDQLWNDLRELTMSMLDCLDRRERFIVRCRYALGAHRKVRTFQYLADKLGVSKERVRQLEQRAVAKLREMAADAQADGLVAATLV